MPSEIDLLEGENLGSIITIAAFLIFIFSSLMAIKVERSRQSGIDLNPSPTPSEVTAVGAWVLVIGSFVLFIISLKRIQQRREQLQSGTSQGTLIPNLWISSGAFLAFAAAIFLIIGVQLKISEGGETAII